MREPLAVLGRADRSYKPFTAIPKEVLEKLPSGVSAESFKDGMCVKSGGAIMLFSREWGAVPKKADVCPPLVTGKEYPPGVRGTLVRDAASGETLKEECPLKDPRQCADSSCLLNRGECSSREAAFAKQTKSRVIIFAPGPIFTKAVRRSKGNGLLSGKKGK